MGWILVIFGIIYIIYKVSDEWSYNHCNAHDVDNNLMMRDASKISQAELKRRYKSGYYNKPKKEEE